MEFTIDKMKLDKVIDLIDNYTADAEKIAKKFIFHDWADAEDHQCFLDNATAQQINEWIISSIVRWYGEQL